jgi:hypothetical protein
MLKVVRQDNCWAAVISSTEHAVILLGDRPATFASGWSATGAITSFAPVILLNLLHTSGDETTWLLDQDFRFLTNAVDGLSDEIAALFSERISNTLDCLTKGFLADPDFALHPGDCDFFSLSDSTSNALLSLVGQRSLPSFKVLDPDKFEQTNISNGSRIFRLDRDHVRKAATTIPEHSYIAACRRGTMSWPSPVDGQPVDDVRGFVLTHVTIAWRCVDHRNDLVFFVIASGFGSAEALLLMVESYFVDERSVLAADSSSSVSANAHIKDLIDHLLLHGRELIPFLQKPTARIAHYMWGEGAVHVGHHHWNEMPGLETIVTRLDQSDYPVIYDLAGAAGTNFYERLSYLFPELSRQVDLSCPTFSAMCRHAYLRGIQIVRFGGAHVSASVRRRIADAIALTSASEEAVRTKQQTPGPVVVFGLRVENRTLTDLVGFYTGLAKAIRQRFDNLTIIIDGHNGKARQSEEAFSSYMEQRATVRPIDVERQTIADLRDNLRRHDIRIVSCVGMTLRENLAWMSIADFCVAPWGAGLAKYRWALNLPTFVLIGDHCKKHKGDIEIYTGMPDMESPTPLTYISEHLVTDRPEFPVLIKMDEIYEKYYVNYEVDFDGAYGEIVDLLANSTRAGNRSSTL